MSIYFEKIPIPTNELFLLRSFKVPFMSYPAHYHPEIEITFIRKSSGQRFVGDHMENFDDGDLVMIGGNLPHQWRNDRFSEESEEGAELSVVHFRQEVIPDSFLQITDFAHIQQLFEESKLGIKFSKNCAQKIAPFFEILEKSDQGDRLVNFFHLLNVLAKSKHRKSLSSSSALHVQSNKSIDKINHVYSYILDNYHEDISLSSIANSVHMSASAFSHFIKKRTGMTYSQLINDLRIKHAGKLLTESDLNITEICYKTGFKNLSYFNRQFKAYKNTSPLEYRKRFKKEYLDSYEQHPGLSISHSQDGRSGI
jgi:AraC-like DNA-binding protein